MSFEIIKKESTLEIIVQQIKDQVKKGILKPGEKLPSERKLAELLGVSRASVREAIQALFSNYSLDYLMEARIMLEGEFARLAALNASQEEIGIIEKIFNEIAKSKDLNSFFVKDLEFHLTIAKVTHNRN